jgi:transposase
MPRAASTDVIVLSDRRRHRLEALVRKQTAPQRVVLRAKIVLAAWRRHPNAMIARDLGVSIDTVRRWRHRFCTHGMPGLYDRPRSGRPPVYDLDVHLAIVATVTSQPETDSQWSHRLLAARLHTGGITISASQIGRILADLDLKPHRVRGWLNRPDDPEFAAKARAICQLYLNPPEGNVLISLDEKTSIQAKSRKHPTRTLRRGHVARREFEYIRHGTVSLIAAMDVRSGEVLGEIIPGKNNSENFIRFLTSIDRAVPPHQNIHVIMDNGSSHTSKLTRAWLTDHPRFTVTYTPKHASWLNMVELFFSVLTRRLLRRGEFTSRQDLADKILTFIANYDQTAKPYRWTYTGDLLKAA